MIKNTLTSKQKRYLRSLGMTMEPVVPIGKDGITPSVVNSADEAVEKRELIKVRVLQNCPEDVEMAVYTLAERTNCDIVQIIGRNGLLWRRNFKKPKIEFLSKNRTSNFRNNNPLCRQDIKPISTV